MTPDRFGFVNWRYTELDAQGQPFREISVRAKLVSEKDGLLTLKTERGQSLKINRDQINQRTNRPLLDWLDAEIAKREAKKDKKGK